MLKLAYISAVGCLLICRQVVDGLSHEVQRSRPVARRHLLGQFLTLGVAVVHPISALAAADCVTDCLKNCKKIAPKDEAYCVMTCKDYCSQEDRTDGLSGSVSADSGEVGILGGTWGQGTVPKGEDRPPSINLPGLDFSSEKGKKLLGY